MSNAKKRADDIHNDGGIHANAGEDIILPKNIEGNTKNLVTSAILIAIATVLSVLTPFWMPFGGNVTLAAMVPIIIIPYLFGLKFGLLSALIYSVIQMLLGVQNFGFLAPTITNFLLIGFLDYIIAFGILGVGRVFSRNLLIGGGIVIALRYASHVVSGVVLWGHFADAADLMHGLWVYSLAYNAAYMVPEFIISLIVLAVLTRVKQIPWVQNEHAK